MTQSEQKKSSAGDQSQIDFFFSKAIKQRLLWQPGAWRRAITLGFGVVITLLLGYIHALTGQAYEFHVFFIVPVLTIAWFIGRCAGYGLAMLSVAAWFVSDWVLAGEQANLSPLVFNTSMRMTIFLLGVRLVSEIRNLLIRESQMAREDELTHLPNRREFHERGRQAFALAQRQQSPFTAVFIDLDHFKSVNDTLGHDRGDQLLMSVATIIQKHVRESDIPGRLGGDEFALLLPNMTAKSASAYVEKLRSRLLQEMQKEQLPVTFSIGVASYDSAPVDFNELLKQADTLMYQVKAGGRDNIIQCEL